MIPIYNSTKTVQKKIRVNKLATLGEYDFNAPHRHNYFEFFYFLDGGGEHIIDFESFEIKSNSIHIVASGQVHEVKRELNSSGFVYLFEIDALQAPSEIIDFLFDHTCYDVKEHSPTYQFIQKDQEYLSQLTQMIWKATNEHLEYEQLIIQNSIQNLCIKCMQTLSNQKNDKIDSIYVAFRKLLFANFREMKKVQDYTSALNISDTVLNDITKTHTGKNTSQLIQNQIILEAKRLLLTGDSVKQTAYKLKYEDPAHFSKFFKINTGYSPTQFLNLHE